MIGEGEEDKEKICEELESREVVTGEIVEHASHIGSTTPKT